MFEFLQTSDSKDRVVLVFDIGSGSVGGALVRIPGRSNDTDSLPTILSSHRAPISSSPHIDFEKLLENTQKALGDVARALHTNNIATPEKIFCVLASPWYISENRVVKIAREQSFVFTHTLADELLNKEIAALKSSYQKKYDEAESAPEIIEHRIMDVKADGRSHKDPLGIKAKSIEMNMLVSLSPKVFLDRVRDVIDRSWSHVPVAFSSFALSSYLAVRSRYVDSDSYILVDVAGEITDVSIVVDDVFKHSLSFPYGKNTLFHQIARTLQVEARDAEELCSLYISGNLESKQKKKVAHAFLVARDSWKHSFHQAIDSLGRTFITPRVVFLTADTIVEPWFKELIADTWNVVTLDGPSFLPICHIEDGPCDPFLMIEAIAIMRTFK